MKILLYILLTILLLVFLIVAYVLLRMVNSCKNIKRLDKEGGLYSLDYVKNYHTVIYDLVFKLLRKSGCSAFCVKNNAGNVITGRNYDMPHFDKDNNLTGLNVVMKIKGKAKYDSINGIDACWLSSLGFPYTKGALDDPKLTKLPLAFFPYLTMDGINEKGLTVSILALDLKEGEKPVNQNEPNKKKYTINQLVRMLLDECANINEAIDLVNNINIVNMLGHDYHLFVSDETGRSIVMEWRFNKFTYTETSATTNFYVGYDDAMDCYYGTDLKEKFVSIDTKKKYQRGYGHGYGRFNTLVKNLDEKTIYEKDEAFKLLGDVAQDYDGMLTSYTQYSVVYNSTLKEADYALWQNYENIYHFDFK